MFDRIETTSILTPMSELGIYSKKEREMKEGGVYTLGWVGMVRVDLYGSMEVEFPRFIRQLSSREREEKGGETSYSTQCSTLSPDQRGFLGKFIDHLPNLSFLNLDFFFFETLRFSLSRPVIDMDFFPLCIELFFLFRCCWRGRKFDEEEVEREMSLKNIHRENELFSVKQLFPRVFFCHPFVSAIANTWSLFFFPNFKGTHWRGNDRWQCSRIEMMFFFLPSCEHFPT